MSFENICTLSIRGFYSTKSTSISSRIRIHIADTEMTRCNICISKLILLNTVFLGGLLLNKVKSLILKLEVISKIDKGFHYRK